MKAEVYSYRRAVRPGLERAARHKVNITQVARYGFRPSVWTQLRSGTIRLPPIKNSELPELEKRMTRYRDHPMDFADSGLVHLAEREPIEIVFSVGEVDFATHSIGRKRKF